MTNWRASGYVEGAKCKFLGTPCLIYAEIARLWNIAVDREQSMAEIDDVVKTAKMYAALDIGFLKENISHTLDSHLYYHLINIMPTLALKVSVDEDPAEVLKGVLNDIKSEIPTQISFKELCDLNPRLELKLSRDLSPEQKKFATADDLV